MRKVSDPGFRVSLQQRRAANPFTEGSRELFDLAGQGRIDTFFLGGAQIDGSGAINLVRADGRRFPGTFGSAYMYSVTKNIILFREEHSRRVLVPKVEFVSARGEPRALVTGKALFSWQKDRRRFRLETFHNASLAEVAANTGFEYDLSPGVGETPPPTAEELSFLRENVSKQLAADYPDFTKKVWGIN
ncbi:MAG TPA: hypothetical protein VNH12_00660 [Burkholderiales bacterium]|nr:hypothetical protein [Burkholderiales bacterium]